MVDQPYGTPPAAQRPEPPEPVHNAYRLMLVRAAMSLVGILATFSQRDTLRRQIIENNPSFSAEKIDQALTIGLTVAVVVGLIFLVLYVLLAKQVRKGASWARVVTFVLAGLGILSGLIGLAGDAPGLNKALALVGVALDASIVWLLTRQPSREYFNPPIA